MSLIKLLNIADTGYSVRWSMNAQNRITVLLGAGAMMDVTTLSCHSITEKVISKEQIQFGEGGWESVPFLSLLYDRLKEYYQREKEYVNFEDIFHALEMISSIKTAENGQAVKSFRSVFGMLCNLKEDFAGISQTLIYSSMRELIDTVIENVAQFEESVYEEDWFPNFFKSLEETAPLDLFTLNYDTWLEQIIGNYNDGFIPFCETHQRFSANQLFLESNRLSTINHLHGQICFTSHLPDRSECILTDGWYKANSYDVIKGLRIFPRHPGFMAKTQAAEQIYQYPIITGLRKNDKIMTPPFDAYYAHLYQKLRCNKNLLIIGYGFGDLYINSLLNQFRSFHGREGNVICVGYLNPIEWTGRIADMPFPISMKQSIYSLFQDSPMSHDFLTTEYCDYIDSPNKKSKLFLCGFKSAVESYGEDIVRFYEV